MSGEDIDDGFTAFWNAHRNRLGRALVLAVGDPELGWEAVDEAMVRAYERWPRVQGLADPPGWVFRVGLNWATSWRRKAGRRPVRPIEQLDRAYQDREVDVDLYRAVARLPVEQRAVVVLRFFLDRPVEEVSQVLQIAEGTVKSRLHRAVATLSRSREVRT